jgi:hypothetical protein
MLIFWLALQQAFPLVHLKLPGGEVTLPGVVALELRSK